MNKKQLSVRFNGKPVGLLNQTLSGKMEFIYDINAEQAISIGMPLREKPYDDNESDAYFGGLLPESDAAKKIIGKRYGISHSNHFALLQAIGYDCAGAVSFHPIEEPINDQSAFPLTVRIIENNELYRHIKELPQKPLFMDVDGLRLSLAGVQDKAAICLVDNQIALAENGCPTTHILKPSPPHFPGMAENEYFCLKIAASLGLPIPDIQLCKIDDITFLLIERYDRQIQNNVVTRIHQEDFCQALNILSSKKYQNEGGPGFKECFELLNKTTIPALDRNLLINALIFNYLIGNMDAHGKNFSLIHHSPDQIRLAPFYDMLCTRVYDHLTNKMAMKIGNKYEADHIFPRHFEQLCKEIQYRSIFIEQLIQKQVQSILQIAAKEKENLKNMGFQSAIINKIIIHIENNIKVLSSRFK